MWDLALFQPKNTFSMPTISLKIRAAVTPSRLDFWLQVTTWHYSNPARGRAVAYIDANYGRPAAYKGLIRWRLLNRAAESSHVEGSSPGKKAGVPPYFVCGTILPWFAFRRMPYIALARHRWHHRRDLVNRPRHRLANSVYFSSTEHHHIVLSYSHRQSYALSQHLHHVHIYILHKDVQALQAEGETQRDHAYARL